MSNIVDHSIFLDFTCSIVRSKIYSNYLFIYFCKKIKKKKRVHKQALQIAMPLTFTTSHLPCSSLFIVKHFFPYVNIHIPKKNTFLKKNSQKKKKKLKVYMTSQIINSETKTILKLNTYKTKQRIKQNKSKLFIYIYIYIYLSIILNLKLG